MSSKNLYKVLNHRVIDGDTIEVDLELLPPIRYHGNLRLTGIDAPEKTSTAGERLKIFLEDYLDGKEFTVSYKKPYKYSGGFIGNIVFEDGTLLTEYLLENGLCRPYGSGKRAIWREDDLRLIHERIDRLMA